MNTPNRFVGFSRFSRTTVGLIAVLATWASLPNAQAAAGSGTWNGGTDSTWSNAANWTTAQPGSNVGATASSTDTATFGAATTVLNGTTASPVVIDSNRNVGSIAFSSQTNAGNAASSYVIGSTSGNILYLTSGGGISAAAIENQQTINAPLVIGASGTAATYSFNNSSFGANMYIGGTITGGGGTGSLALTFKGGNGGGGGNLTDVTGVISNGGASDLTSITLSGVYNQGGGTGLELSGTNTYSGGTTITQGNLIIANNSALGTGTLTLNPSALATISTDGTARSIANNILFSNAATGDVDFVGTGNLTVSGTTYFTTNGTEFLNQATGTLSLGAVSLSTTATTGINTNLAGYGNTTISGIIADGSSSGNSLTYGGTGTLTLSGHTTSTGGWALNAGTVVLDYTTNSDTGSKLGSGALTIGGVNLQLKGGSGTQSTGNVSFTGGGQANITRTGGGTETLAMGTLTGATSGVTATAVNFQSGIATTTSTTTNSSNAIAGLLGSSTFYTVGTQGAADWAATSSGTIVQYSSVNSYATLNNTVTAGTYTTNFSATNSQSTSGSLTIPTLKIIENDNGADSLTLSGTLTLGANGGILDTSASATNGYTITGSTIAEGTGVNNIQQYGDSSLTINSIISGSAVLEKAGPGTLILGGPNTYTGALAISQGTVTFSTNGNLGGTSAAIDLNGGALDLASGSGAVSFGATRTVTLGADGGTIEVDSGSTLTDGAALVNAVNATPGSLTKTGSGTLVLTAASSYTGGTYLNGGTIQAGIKNAIDTSILAAGTTNPFVINGGTFDVNGFDETVGPLTLVSGTIKDSVGGGYVNAASYNLQSGTVSAELSDFGGAPGGGGIESNLVKTGTGTVVLSGENGFTGNISINGGVLQVDSADAATGVGTLGSTNVINAAKGVISFGGGTLQFSSANAYDYSNRIANSASAISIDTNGRYVTFASAIAISNTGGLTLDDTNGTPGGLLLGGANLFTGAITDTAGTLTATSASAFNPANGGAVSVATGATLDYNATANSQLGLHSTLSLAGGSVFGGSLGTTLTGADVNVTGAVSTSGTNAVKVNIFGNLYSGTAGTYTLLQGASGVNSATYSLGTVYGDTNFAVGAFTSSTGSLAVAITNATAITGAYWAGGESGAPNVWSASNGTTSNWVTAATGGATSLVPGSTANVTISAYTVTTAPTATILGTNMSINSLTIANTTYGLGLSSDGYTLTIMAGTSNGNTASNGITMNTSVPNSTIGANVALGAAQTWTNNSANTLTVSGIVSGAYKLTTAGTGNIILTGTNTYSGGTAVTTDTLVLGTGGSLSTSNTLALGSGASSGVFQLGDANGAVNTTVTSLTTSGTGIANDAVVGGNGLNSTASVLTVNTTALDTYGGVLGGAGSNQNLLALTKSGTGTLDLTGADTYTGATLVGNGTLILGTGGSLSSSTTLTLGVASTSSGIFQLGDSSGAVNTTVTSLATTGTVSATNAVVGGNASATSTLTVNNSVADTFGGIQGTLGGGTATANNLALVKSGAGTLALTSANTYTGGTTVQNGVLQVGVAGALGSTSGALAVNTGTLDLDGTSQTVGNFSGSSTSGTILNSATGTLSTLTVGNGTTSSVTGTYTGLIENNGGSGGTVALAKTGSDLTTLTGTNTYSGGTSISGGVLYANTTGSAVSATGTGAVSVTSGGTLSGSGSIRPTVSTGTAVTVASGGSLTPGGVQPTPLYTSNPTNPANGNLTLDPTNVSTSAMLLSVASSGSLTAPQLTFAIGSGGTFGTGGRTGASEIVVGGAGTTANTINFNAGNTGAHTTVVSINDLVGGSLTLYSPYILIQGEDTTFEDNGSAGAWTSSGGTGLAAYTGPSTALGTDKVFQITGGLTLLASGNGNTFANYYGASVLIYDYTTDSIDVEVVPEPGTWAMMLGGLAMLVLWQRRKSKRN